MSNLLLVLAAVALVALNGFFVAAEFGLVKLRATRVKTIATTSGLPGRILLKVHGQLDAYLSACQLGITLASLGLGWIGEPAFARLLEPVLAIAGIESPQLIHGIAFIFAFLTISYLHIVAGELAPKSMALRLPEKISLWCALPLYLFYWAMYPAIWFLNHSSNTLLKLAGLNGRHGHDSQYSVDELKLIMRGSRPHEGFTADEWGVLAHSLDFSNLDVADLMRPFGEVVALSESRATDDNLALVAQHRFSRYPYLDRQGKVIGLLHLKDLFLARHRHGGPAPDVHTLLRPVQFIKPDMPAIELFRRFRDGAPHFAVVGRKGQPPMGFITLDNMLGALVGEIRDEFRQARNDWTRQDDGTLLGKGSLPIFTLERALDIDIESDDDVDSVGGLLMSKLGDLPEEGERIEFPQFDVVVKRMDGPRIVLLKIYPHQHEPSPHGH